MTYCMACNERKKEEIIVIVKKFPELKPSE